MTSRTLLGTALVALTATLSACSPLSPPGQEAAASAAIYQPKDASSLTPKVSVDPQTGAISISPRYLVFAPEQRNVTITWSLPADGRYRFVPIGEGGVVVEGELLDKVVDVTESTRLEGYKPGDKLVPLKKQDQIVNCKVSENGLQAMCLNVHSRPGVFKYLLRVQLPGGKPVVIDPIAMNW